MVVNTIPQRGSDVKSKEYFKAIRPFRGVSVLGRLREGRDFSPMRRGTISTFFGSFPLEKTKGYKTSTSPAPIDGNFKAVRMSPSATSKASSSVVLSINDDDTTLPSTLTTKAVNTRPAHHVRPRPGPDSRNSWKSTSGRTKRPIPTVCSRRRFIWARRSFKRG